MTNMAYRVDLDFIGLGRAGAAYGGHLHAWSFRNIDGPAWFAAFRQEALGAIGTRYLPIYRMADGEYRFLFGRRVSWSRKPLWREILGVCAETLRLKNPDRWKTSWGETYTPQETRRLRAELLEHIRQLSRQGYLACYVNDNALHAFVEYNGVLEGLFAAQGITLHEGNYIPFHFAPALFINEGWQDFINDRSLLIVTGLNDEKAELIRRTLLSYGAGEVHFLPISATASLTDRLDLSQITATIDIALIGAGIGSANILRQLEPLQTLCVDIGGFMNCFCDPVLRQHGGVIGLPRLE